MKLSVLREIEGDEILYCIPFQNGKYARTLHLTQVECHTSESGEISHIVMDGISPDAFAEFRRLASKYDEFQINGNQVTLTISSMKPERSTTCMVNIDFDDKGQMLSIEII